MRTKPICEHSDLWDMPQRAPPGCCDPQAATPNHCQNACIIGFRAADGSFIVVPAFPEKMVSLGAACGIENLRYRSVTFRVNYRVGPDDTVAVELECRGEQHQAAVVTDEKGDVLAGAEFRRGAARIAFDGRLFEQYTILLSKRRTCKENRQ